MSVVLEYVLDKQQIIDNIGYLSGIFKHKQTYTQRAQRDNLFIRWAV